MAIVLKLLTLFLTTTVFAAGYNGRVEFSNQEKTKHKREIQVFVNIASGCLEDFQREHIEFYRSHCRSVEGQKVCLSKYYGERRYSKKRNARRADGKPLQYLPEALAEAGFPDSYVDLMEANSCVGMALTCLKQAFLATDQEGVWLKLRQFSRDNGVSGVAIQHALGQLGWRTYYWNPSPLETIERDTKTWDREETNWQSKGGHFARYKSVRDKGTYWYNTVDDKSSLVGFGRGEPELLKRVPFWVGTANTGYHVFPGTFADVVEAHSTRPITAEDNLEFSRFAPFATGGGPRWTDVEKYRSGLISVPPIF